MKKREQDAPADLGQFKELLQYLKRNRGFDFSGYKPASVLRRVRKRMDMVGITGFDHYIDYLEVHPEEFALLFNHILINVTCFFRDPAAWDFLNESILPNIIAGKTGNQPIRVWSAGCASGQEPFTVAILLHKQLGCEGFQERVKIYASDVDDNALTQARQGTYQESDVQMVPPHLLEAYFESSNGKFIVRPDLRRAVIFGRHDLVNDAPISRLDLLICRNTLMYFNAETQSQIITRFHFALNKTGYLFLGKAEMLLTNTNLFHPVDFKCRIFQKVGTTVLRNPLNLSHHSVEEEATPQSSLRLADLAFDTGLYAHLVVDLDGNLAMVNERARIQFGLGPNDLDRPFRDLEMSYRPVELRGPIEQVCNQRQPVRLPRVELTHREGPSQYFDVDVTPLVAEGGRMVGVNVFFHEITQTVQLESDLHRSQQELETAYEELQSTTEELETTNEELQSTNEELETMNSELQATNEELQTVNTELQERTEQLQQANLFQKAILASLGSGVAVLDEHLTVRVWNPHAEELWGLRADEVTGKPFMQLDIGLPVGQLMEPIRQVTNASSARHHRVELAAINRRGRAFTCRVTCSSLRETTGQNHGVIIFMEDPGASEGPA
ncbi:CheR family methyltransferase [Candidatus Nitrospira bockiana]